jgi:RecA-family ATPase
MTTSKKKRSPIGIDEILRKEIRKSPPVLINGVLPGEGGMLLAGESEIGKSLMRAEWSVLLACGLDVYGMKTPSAQTVCVFQSENSLSTEKERIQRIMAGHGIESVHNRIHYARFTWERSLLSKSFREAAIQQIEIVGATVCFWDPLISFLPSTVNENNNVAMRAALDNITYINRQCKCAAIVIDHFGQPGSDPKSEIPLKYRIRGASAKRDWADTIIAVQATAKSENPGPGRKLSFTKIRTGPPRPPLFLERDRNFVHHRTTDKRKATAITVIEVIRLHGDENGYCGSQNELCALIQESAGCSKRPALNAVKEALEAEQIEEKIVDGSKIWRVVT